MDAPKGSIVAYSTGPGSLAADGDDRNGLYTSKLLKHLLTPGLEIGRLFRKIRVDVMDASGERQIPWEEACLTKDFYFVNSLVDEKKLGILKHETTKISAKVAEESFKKIDAAAEMHLAEVVKKVDVKPVEMPITKATFDDDDVFFGVNSTSLNANAKKMLANKAKWLQSNPIASVAVEVYCDSRGSHEYNMKLAAKRAKNVVKYMTAAGIDASRLEIVIHGAVDSVANENAWANNRRAHFKIK